jgi:hypothetical protein
MFSFELADEDVSVQLDAIRDMKDVYGRRGIVVSVHRDQTRSSRFLLTLETEESMEVVTKRIQDEPHGKAVFEHIRQSGSRLLVSVYEKII